MEPSSEISIKNHLKTVVLALNFGSDLMLSNEKAIGAFSKQISDLFPSFQPEDRFSFELNVGPEGRNTSEKRERAYRFINEKEGSILLLGTRDLTVELTKYISYDQFRSMINRIVNLLGQFGANTVVMTMGLRYINEIKMPKGSPYDWDNLIKTPLTASINLFEDKQKLTRSMGLIELNDLNYRIRFQYGWFNSQYPNPISQREFVLDYDCISKDPFALTEIMYRVDGAHDIIKQLFEMSTNKGLMIAGSE